jgi:hypothetical protein
VKLLAGFRNLLLRLPTPHLKYLVVEIRDALFARQLALPVMLTPLQTEHLHHHLSLRHHSAALILRRRITKIHNLHLFYSLCLTARHVLL